MCRPGFPDPAGRTAPRVRAVGVSQATGGTGTPLRARPGHRCLPAPTATHY